jgi:voltage-gated sodium channel
MVAWCRRVADSRWFQNGALLVIVLAAAVAGLETSEPLVAAHGATFHTLGRLIQAVFVVELTIRLVAFWPGLHRFFADGWNSFDFAIVAASFLPASGSFATVGRLARLLRAARLFSRVPELRLITGTMIRSIPSMGHVLILVALLLYIYTILGFHMFGDGDPTRWGGLDRAVLTLVGVLTLEGWVAVQEEALAVNSWAWLYFASFIVMAVFVSLNLFIAIVINNLEATKAEEASGAAAGEGDSRAAALRHLREINAKMADLENALRRSG